jgi:hypothetical protein
MPQELLHYLDDNGAFSVHITNRPGHATAMDETHEMIINKIVKDVVVKPNPELMEQICHGFPFRSECQNQLKEQIGLEKENSCFSDAKNYTKISDVKVRKMIELIQS